MYLIIATQSIQIQKKQVLYSFASYAEIPFMLLCTWVKNEITSTKIDQTMLFLLEHLQNRKIC